MSTKGDSNSRSDPLEAAWTTPQPGNVTGWLLRQVGATGIALGGVLVFASVVAISARLENPYILIGLGVIGTIGLLRHRISGKPVLHAAWVISLFVFLTGLFALPFCLLAE